MGTYAPGKYIIVAGEGISIESLRKICQLAGIIVDGEQPDKNNPNIRAVMISLTATSKIQMDESAIESYLKSSLGEQACTQGIRGIFKRPAPDPLPEDNDRRRSQRR